ncbi:TPA: hypothetical protein ACG3R2_003815 [Clostridioides difficile]|nr:hypothetical protein [Clostridioides difficile]
MKHKISIICKGIDILSDLFIYTYFRNMSINATRAMPNTMFI